MAIMGLGQTYQSYLQNQAAEDAKKNNKSPKGMSTNYGSYDMSGNFSPSAPGIVAGVSNTKTSSSGGSSGGVPQKYDAAGHITEAYKKYRDAKNASSGSGSSSSAAKDAEKMQIAAEKRAEQAQIEAEQRAVAREAATKAANDAIATSSISKGYDDLAPSFDASSSALGNSNTYINNLGNTRDQMLSAIEGYKNKTDAAIAGNKTLIEENQKRDLDALAKETRKSTENTNVMLGVKGASGGSASKAAARAITESAGKARYGILTGYGDETSAQNQASRKNTEDYQTKRAQAYEWEKTAREQALDDYSADVADLDSMKKSESGWKDEDIKALSDRNLQTLKSRLADIQTRARNFRATLAAKMTEYGANADALDVAAVTVTPPAELSTPKFDENIDFTDPNNSADWFDPSKQGKRVVVGKNALGQSVDENGNVIEVDENGNPIV